MKSKMQSECFFSNIELLTWSLSFRVLIFTSSLALLTLNLSLCIHHEAMEEHERIMPHAKTAKPLRMVQYLNTEPLNSMSCVILCELRASA
jgi:hypothetical protein